MPRDRTVNPPSTEAGRRFRDALHDLGNPMGGDRDWALPSILAIEEQARTEGRQQAVRLYEFLHHLPGCAAGYLWGTEPADQCDCGLSDAIGVAGLNASESPPPDQWCEIHQHYKPCEHNGGVMGATGYEWASESPPPEYVTPEEMADVLEKVGGLRSHIKGGVVVIDVPVGDASESGQPPEASDE